MRRDRNLQSLAAACFLLAAPYAAAQQYAGPVASACPTVDAQGGVTVPTTQGVSAGAVLLVSVATKAAVLSDLAVSDPNGSSYLPIGSTHVRGSGLTVSTFNARIAQTLASGAALRVKGGNLPAGSSLCVTAGQVDDLGTGFAQLHSAGSTQGSGSSLVGSLDRPGNGVPQLLIAAFATAGDPGALSASGLTLLPTVCDINGALCLVSGTTDRADIGAYSVGAAATNPVAWVGAAAGVYRNSIFSDGFE